MKTTTPKNPLRQLASHIVSTCQQEGAKGIKQSTVLKALSEANGFRSVQCSDAATPRTGTGTEASRLAFLHVMLFSAYPNSDLFALEADDIAGRALTAEDIDTLSDRAFVALWNTLTLAPRHFITTLDTWRDDLVNLLANLAQPIVPQGVTSPTTLLNDPLWRDFINAEMRECAEGLTGEARYNCYRDVLHRLEEDLTTIYDAFEGNSIAWAWCSCGRRRDLDAPTYRKISANITPEGDNLFTV